MVIREWRGRAAPDKVDEYPRHFGSNVLPELRRIDGFRAAFLTRREIAGQIEFLVLTHWESMNAIRAFAGDDAERAIVEPGGVAALLDFDPHVRHYEVLEDLSSPG